MPRNSSGTYSLPAGNPVVSGTLIETNWANPTMSDIGSSITDSLDRFGRGGMLAQLKLADGTLAAPAFAFNSEASTGFYRPAAATLNLSVLGSLVASFTSTAITFSKATTFAAGVTINGAVTLAAVLAWFGGTAALPGLAVAGDLDTGFYSVAANTVGASTSGVSRWLTTDEGLGLNATVAALGSVGPQLQVRGRDATHAGYLSVVETGGAAWIGLYSGITVADNPSVMFNNTGALRFGTTTAQAVSGYVELMRLTATGRLGIGRTPTSTPLEVAGTIQAIGANGTDTSFAASITAIASHATGFNSTGITNGYGAPTGTAYLGLGQAFPLVFTTNALERMRIEGGGNVGIGGSPTVKFDVIGSGATAAIVARSTDASGASGFLNANGSTSVNFGALSNHALLFHTNSIVRATLDATGNFGVGVTPSYKLDILSPVSGAKLFRATASGTATLFGFADGSGSGITNADPQTGGALVYLSSQIIELFTGGNERMRVDASGGVGIGGLAAGRFSVTSTTTAGAGGLTTVWSNAYSVFGPNAGSTTGAAFGIGYNTTLGQTELFSAQPGTAWKPLALFCLGASFASTGGAEGFAMTSDGRFYGKALHNNAGAITGTTNQYVASGTYTATITATTNCSAPATAGPGTFTRVGNVVNVAVNATATITADSTQTRIDISLPIASNLAAINDLTGCGTANVIAGQYARDAQGVPLQANTAGDTAQIIFTSQVGSAGTTRAFQCVFQYVIL